MSNSAHIVEGPAGTPTQAFWDGFINALDNLPPIDVINDFTKKLNGYVNQMNEAISSGAREAYDMTLGQFTSLKSEALDYMNECKDNVESEISDVSEGKVEAVTSAQADLDEEITDIETDITNMTATNTAGTTIETAPGADEGELSAWAAKVIAWEQAQKTSFAGQIAKFNNDIKRLKKKFDPIVAAVTWWPTTIGLLAAYMTKRISDIVKSIASITNITPPSYPTV